MRRPIALDIIRDGLEVSAKALGVDVCNLNLLDAGCGTGNYTHALHGEVGTIVGMDFNDGMLEQAKRKVANGSNVVLQQGSITDMPFVADTFDGVIMNQVLHHIETPETISNWQNVTATLTEIRRVLKPGGAFIVSTQTPQQHLDGFWWAPIIPDAAAKLATRFPDQEWMESKLIELGFNTIEFKIPTEPLIPVEYYLNKDGPFDPVFRNGDSTWSLATEGELKKGLEWWKIEVDTGRAEDFLAEREKIRSQIGQTTSIIAY